MNIHRVEFALKALLMASPLSVLPAHQASAEPLSMRPPTQSERNLLTSKLGAKFVHGSDPDTDMGPPNLVVATADLNRDGIDDLIAAQGSRCTNHTCKYVVLLSSPTGLDHVASIESWDVPEVSKNSHGGVRDLIIYDHLTDDCMACSDPEPVLFIWSASARRAHGKKGTYIWSHPLRPQKKSSAGRH